MLIYSLNSDGKSYSVAEETDSSVTRVVIPDTYEGLPVTELSADFTHCENLKEIVTGNSVKTIAYGVLEISSLERLYLGNGIEIINGPLSNSGNLTDLFYCGTEDDFTKIQWLFIDNAENVIVNLKKHFGVMGKGALLSFGEEKLFPYTHWDCVKGKPEEISSEKVVYDNSISGLQAENVKDAIDELNAKHFDVSSLDSWKDFLHLVRSGKAADFIQVGDQLVSLKNGEELVWDVIGIDADEPVDERHKHSVTLQLRDCFNNMPFSALEASFLAVKELSPGQYYLKMKNYAADPVYYAFTLSETLSIGSLIRISENTVYLYKKRTENYYSSFPVDLCSENEEDMTGVFLNQQNYKIHSEMGATNYKVSDIRKWLNSAEDNWWSYSSDWSLASPEYSTVSGFCKDMDEDFLNAVNPVVKRTVLADGSEVVTEDKFFLLSAEEVYASEGTAYEYYRENTSLPAPGTTKENSRIKMFDSAPRHWWLRNAAPGDNGLMRVLTDGGVGSVKAAKILAYGVAPACVIC